MGGGLFTAALVAWAFGIAGIIVWLIDSASENAICASPNEFSQACLQLQNTANITVVIGFVGIVFGIILTVMALKDP
jgi:hypothetical protein